MPSAPEAFAAQDAGMWVIEPRQLGAFSRLRELWSYRYLWWYFASATVTAMYRRSALGWLWLVLRVAGPIGLNAVVFGSMLNQADKVEDVPYFLFFLCGMATWMLFERSLQFVTRSVERHRRTVTRVYFPRLILPMSAVAPGLVYFAVTLVVMLVTLVVFQQRDGRWYIPAQPRLLVALACVGASLFFAVAVGLWTSVLQARYRDISYGLRYVMPFWFYFTPVIYPLSQIPESYRWIVAINPMAPIVEAFKWGTLGYGTLHPAALASSLVLMGVTMVSGLWFFNREESASVDKL